jgi:hypothetical protein
VASQTSDGGGFTGPEKATYHDEARIARHRVFPVEVGISWLACHSRRTPAFRPRTGFLSRDRVQ